MLSGKGGRGLKSLLIEDATGGCGEASGMIGRAARSLRLKMMGTFPCCCCRVVAVFGLSPGGRVSAGGRVSSPVELRVCASWCTADALAGLAGIGEGTWEGEIGGSATGACARGECVEGTVRGLGSLTNGGSGV